MPVHKCPNGKYRIGSGKCMYDSKEKAERAYAAYKAQKHKETKNEKSLNLTKYDEIEKLKENIDEEISSLYDIQTVLNSLKIIFNFIETGKPYPENEVY